MDQVSLLSCWTELRLECVQNISAAILSVAQSANVLSNQQVSEARS